MLRGRKDCPNLRVRARCSHACLQLRSPCYATTCQCSLKQRNNASARFVLVRCSYIYSGALVVPSSCDLCDATPFLRFSLFAACHSSLVRTIRAVRPNPARVAAAETLETVALAPPSAAQETAQAPAIRNLTAILAGVHNGRPRKPARSMFAAANMASAAPPQSFAAM